MAGSVRHLEFEFLVVFQELDHNQLLHFLNGVKIRVHPPSYGFHLV
jgi:hypothetical protein